MVAPQLYNMFPRLLWWVRMRGKLLRNNKLTAQDNMDIIKHLEETLDPRDCRGFVDCFLIRKQKEEVRL